MNKTWKLKDRAKTPEEKREVVERIYRAWLKAPELRLGQLIFVALDSKAYRLSYSEDFKIANNIESFVNEQQLRNILK